MSLPNAMIGPAVIEVFGLSPEGYDWSSSGRIAKRAVFDSEPFYQPTGMDETTETVRLATRPHTHGGLATIAILKMLVTSQQAVPFLRLVNGIVGQNMGTVIVQKLSREEKVIAWNGIGYRYTVTAELLYVGRLAAGGWS